jgi:hypothetical protein
MCRRKKSTTLQRRNPLNIVEKHDAGCHSVEIHGLARLEVEIILFLFAYAVDFNYAGTVVYGDRH